MEPEPFGNMSLPAGTANFNRNAEFSRYFLLKMQKLWRITPEKRWLSIKKTTIYFAIRGKTVDDVQSGEAVRYLPSTGAISIEES